MTHVSPSQASTWEDCRAGWGWSRVRGKVPNEYAAFGDRGHLVAERWLRDGIPPNPDEPEGACILAGIDRLPMPGTALVETRFDFMSDGHQVGYYDPEHPDATPEGWAHYTGRIDFLYGYDPGRVIVVGDHKTTGNLTYAKDEDVLRADPQRIIYSVWAAATYNVEFVASHWQYYRRKPPKSETRLVVEAVAVTRERFREFHHRVALPIVRAAGIHPSQLPKDGIEKGLCDRWYGKPCPYRDECLTGVSSIARAAALLRKVDMTTTQGNLLGTLQAMAGQAPAAPAPQTPVITPEIQAMYEQSPDPATKDAIARYYKLGQYAEQPAAPAAPQVPAAWQPPQAAPAAPQFTPAPAPVQFQAPAPAPQAFVPPSPAPMPLPAAPPAPPTSAPKVRAKMIKMDRQMFLLFQSGVPGRTVEDAMRWAEAVGL